MARLDTGWHVHPKVLALGLAGMGLHAWSISYCDHALSDGFIPAGAWPALPGVRAAVRAVVRAGLWMPTDGGYLLHDYTDYNRTRAHVASLQAAKRAAGQAGGQASAQARAQANGKQTPKQTLKQNPTPGPGPLTHSLPAGMAMAGPATRARAPAREDTDPKLLAEHLELMARDRASRAGPSQPDLRISQLNGETN